MKEFSGLMRVEIEVIIEAKNQGEAEKIFDDIYPNIFRLYLVNMGNGGGVLMLPSEY